jgi:hypothetical protein
VEEFRDLMEHRIEMLKKNREKILKQMGVVEKPAAPSGDKAALILKGQEIARQRQKAGESALDHVPRELSDIVAATLGTMDAKFPGMFDDVLVKVEDYPGLKAIASFQPTTRMLRLSPEYLNDKGFPQMSKQMEEQGWWSKTGAHAWERTIAHELGHALYFTMKLDKSSKEGFRAYFDMWSKIRTAAAPHLPGHATPEEILHEIVSNSPSGGGSVVSQYGMTNDDEFIAETIAEYAYSDTPRTAARIIGEAFEALYGVKAAAAKAAAQAKVYSPTNLPPPTPG